MPVVQIAHQGQIKGTGDILAQFLKVFAGEILVAYERSTKTGGRHITRNITSGKSAVFPILGRADCAYLSPGNSLDDQRKNINGNELTILIDGLLTSSQMLSDIEDTMSHFEVRGEYSTQMGEALAVACDGAVLAEIAKMAKSNLANLDELGKPSIIAKTAPASTPVISATLGQLYMDGIMEAKIKLDDNYTPATERYAYVTSDVIMALLNAKVISSRDYSDSGSITEGTATRLAGFELVQVTGMTNGGANAKDILQGDGHVFPADLKATCKIICCHRTSVGTLNLKSVSFETARRIEYQADMIVAKLATGHKGLRPESVALVTMTLA